MSIDPSHYPPPLRPLKTTIEAIPADLLPWIAEKHVQYLDDRIHRIGPLTEYLAGCAQVAAEREEFISFVDLATRQDDIILSDYLQQYAYRFRQVRERVESLCDRSLSDGTLWKDRKALLDFWRDFTYINEVDSLHGMFLTSGRWYVNVMLPVVKELIFCTLPEPYNGRLPRGECAYHVARRVITPRFADVPGDYDVSMEKRFAKLFVPILTYYDRKLLFLFEVLAELPRTDFTSIEEFAHHVSANPQVYKHLVDMGVYPPFAWHEMHASRRVRRPALDYRRAIEPILAAAPSPMKERASVALEYLGVFKEYELNYNNYNYKGRFGLVSKYQYWRTLSVQPPDTRDEFLSYILLDNFYSALSVFERSVQIGVS